MEEVKKQTSKEVLNNLIERSYGYISEINKLPEGNAKRSQAIELRNNTAKKQISEYGDRAIPTLVEIYTMAKTEEAKKKISSLAIAQIGTLKQDLKIDKYYDVISECEYVFESIKVLLLAMKEGKTYKEFEKAFEEFNDDKRAIWMESHLSQIYQAETKDKVEEDTDGVGF